MRLTEYREPARLLFHLNTVSRIMLEQYEGHGMANGGEWEIPTESIPSRLRTLGSRFVVVWHHIELEDGDSVEDLREALKMLQGDCTISHVPVSTFSI